MTTTEIKQYLLAGYAIRRAHWPQGHYIYGNRFSTTVDETGKTWDREVDYTIPFHMVSKWMRAELSFWPRHPEDNWEVHSFKGELPNSVKIA